MGKSFAIALCCMVCFLNFILGMEVSKNRCQANQEHIGLLQENAYIQGYEYREQLYEQRFAEVINGIQGE